MLTVSEKQMLHNAGFTLNEIDLLDHAVDPAGKPQKLDLTTPAWRDAIAHRKEFTEKARRVYRYTHGYDLTRDRYNNLVNMTFKGDIFQWLKITYQPRKKTDFQAAVKYRAIRKEQQLKNIISGK